MKDIITNMLWMLRDKADAKKYPLHRKEVFAEAKKWNVKLPVNKFNITTVGSKVTIHKLNFDDLPNNYSKLNTNIKELLLYLDYGKLADRGGVTYFWIEQIKMGRKNL